MTTTTKDLVENEVPGTRVLASMILGCGRGNIVQDTESKRSVSFRLDPSLVKQLDEFARKAEITRTAVVEMLLFAGIQRVKDEMEIIEEFEGPAETHAEGDGL